MHAASSASRSWRCVRWAAIGAAVAVFLSATFVVLMASQEASSASAEALADPAPSLAPIDSLTETPPAAPTSSTSSPEPEPLIVGGTTVGSIAEAPWTATLLRASLADPGQAQFCGATIVSDRWLVTAAHCVDDLVPSQVQVAVGIADLRLITSSLRRSVSSIVVHPGWNPNTSANDIALMRLSAALPVNGTTVVPVALPFTVDPSVWPAINTQALITGWGRLQTGGSLPWVLQKATVLVAAGPGALTCISYSSSVYLRTSMLCAGHPLGGVDSCQGDSGGPLVITTNSVSMLAGVTSGGYGCAIAAYPGIYARVTSYVSWISGITGLVAPIPPTLPPAEGALFHPVSPFRAHDTRNAPLGALHAGETRLIPLPHAPAGAVGLTATVTAVRPDAAGYLTVFPCGGPAPGVSSVNFGAGQIVPNQVTVGLVGGAVCVYAPVRSHVIIDVAGWWRAAPGGSSLTSVAPRRVADTRKGEIGGRIGPGQTAILSLGATLSSVGTPGATAVSLNMTAIRPSELTFLTVYPCGSTRPVVSTMNPSPWSVRANTVTVALDHGRQVCIHNEAGSVDVAVDLTGAWTASTAGGLITLATPDRMVDTRRVGHTKLGTTVRRIIRPSPGTLFANLTVTRAGEPAWVAVFPCADGYQGTSNANVAPGETNANAVTVNATSGVCALASSPVDVIVDAFAVLL